jgi:hypothetical protein
MSEPLAPSPDRRWTEWIVKAVLAAGAAAGVGMGLLGLPGAIVLEFVSALGLARKLAPDSAWPLAILITIAGSFAVVPSSLALRWKRPDIAGWAHVWRAGLLTLAATLVIAVALLR